MAVIPKTIHYCWFGGKPLPSLARDCIESWKKYCPDYEIIEWNEERFDIHANRFVEEAYVAGKWAFVSDYVRLYALYYFGGIYLDTDVEILQPLDRFLEEKAFTGFEAKDMPVTAVMGCQKGNPLYEELLNYYADRSFIVNGQYDITPNTIIITDIFQRYGVKLNGKKQTVANCTIYPEKTFCPNSLRQIFGQYPKESYAIHHFMDSWGKGANGSNQGLAKRFRRYLVRSGRDLIGSEQIARLSSQIRKVRK